MEDRLLTLNGKILNVDGKALLNKGIIPQGKIDITTTDEIDVTAYATAQVVDEDLIADNIKKDVNILGVTGTFEGAGGNEDLIEALCNNTLTSYSNSNITSVKKFLFSESKIENVNFPNATRLYQGAFTGCRKLTKALFAKVEVIETQVFRYDTALTDIYLGYNGLVSLSATSAFDSVTAGVKIHVRPEYADQYATATNWSSLITAGTIVIVGDYSD